jgi:hypothetical protein
MRRCLPSIWPSPGIMTQLMADRAVNITGGDYDTGLSRSDRDCAPYFATMMLSTVKYAIAAESLESTALRGSWLCYSGCCGANACTRSSANMAWV